MERKRDGFVAAADLAIDLPGVPVPPRRDRRRQARHFTQLDQVTQLVAARDADPELGFMARLLALCSLPRTDPKTRHEFKRVNGPYTLYMVAGGGNKLPYGTVPRLLLAWVCNGSGTDAITRAHPRRFALGVHAEGRHLQHQRRPSTPDFGIRCGGCLDARSRCSTRMRAGKPR